MMAFEVWLSLSGDGKAKGALAFTPMAAGINSHPMWCPLPCPKGTHSYVGLCTSLASPSSSPTTHMHLDQHWVCSRLVTLLWQSKERQRDERWRVNSQGGERWKEYICGVGNGWIDHWLKKTPHWGFQLCLRQPLVTAFLQDPEQMMEVARSL